MFKYKSDICRPKQIQDAATGIMLHLCSAHIKHEVEMYLLTSSSRKALSHSFWPGACWVHSVMSWLMLSVTALKHIAHSIL